MDSVTCMASPWDMSAITPDGKLKQRVQGKTRKTWQFNNVEKDRVQVALASEGRPVKAEIQLWIGPDWTPFTLKAYSEDGKKRPINTLVGTRNKAAMGEVRNEGEYEFPFDAAANYAQGPMAALALDIPKGMPDAERVDGGAVRSNVLESATEHLEVVLNTEGRQLNARIELLAGPNNPKQMFEVFTNNGELNSLCVASIRSRPATPSVLSTSRPSSSPSTTTPRRSRPTTQGSRPAAANRNGQCGRCHQSTQTGENK